MATLNEMKKRLEEAADLDKIGICKGESNKVMIDLNGDGEPEAALIDTNDSGNADLLALDVTGDHKFNLFLDDTDENSFPDVTYIDRNGDGNLQLMHFGEEIKDKLQARLVRIFVALTDPSADAEKLHEALEDLAASVREIKRARENREK